MNEKDVYAKVFGVEMELMDWDCHMEFNAYQSFYRNYYSEFAEKNLVPISKTGGSLCRCTSSEMTSQK